VGDAATIKIGTQGTQTAAYVAGIYGETAADGIEVFVDSAGKLGTKSSSGRFKEGIQPMDKASESILALQPVTFRYKKELDPRGIPQFGLVAEQVEKVNPDLVTRDQNGRVFSVRYEAVNAMLLNEFLKEHQKVQDLQAQVDTMAAQMKEQAKVIQQVSDKLEISNLPLRVASNTR
jgi:trimeric autotransporter adhesin